MVVTKQSTFLPYFWLFGLILDPENGDSTFLRNLGERLPDYTVSYQVVGVVVRLYSQGGWGHGNSTLQEVGVVVTLYFPGGWSRGNTTLQEVVVMVTLFSRRFVSW
jgi:hypothetical protein